MSAEQAEQNYREALEKYNAAMEGPLAELEDAKKALDKELLEEEVGKQAVFFGISEDEARERIEQNRYERANDLPRTIWDEPNREEA